MSKNTKKTHIDAFYHRKRHSADGNEEVTLGDPFGRFLILLCTLVIVLVMVVAGVEIGPMLLFVSRFIAP